MTNIHDGHRERLRKQKDSIGLKNLSEVQQLELLLSAVVPRKDTNEIAHRLLKRFGSIYNICNSAFSDLTLVEGVGKSIATFLNFLPEAIEIYVENVKTQHFDVKNFAKQVDYFIRNLDTYEHEEVQVLHLDANNNVLMFEKHTDYNEQKVTIESKKILLSAIKYNTTNLIICHNHPKASACPSLKDDAFMQGIKVSLAGIGVNLVESIILGKYDCYSQRLTTVFDYERLNIDLPDYFKKPKKD